MALTPKVRTPRTQHVIVWPVVKLLVPMSALPSSEPPASTIIRVTKNSSALIIQKNGLLKSDLLNG